ncbi:hypothetical protein ACIBCM_10320 [Streptomyces sp. NPDC051018]|uniref:hypothetical protein n=1 Tax=Streptomyces sp. NPDC051018 TaxID=3365639 RepID=UPI0037AC02B4
MAQDRARWNAETQSWEQGEGPAAYAPPPLPLLPPDHAPGTAHPAGAPARLPLGRMPVVVAAATAVFAVAGTAVWLTTRDDGKSDSPGSAAPASPSGTDPTPSESEEPDVSGDTAGSTGAPEEFPGAEDTATPSASLPAGFRVVEDEEGFTIAAPEEWERTLDRDGVFYTAPDKRSLLQIFVISEISMTPLEAVRAAGEGLAAQTEDYREISLGPVIGGPENPDGDAAELHYAYLSEVAGGVRECIERAFTATNGTKYAVLACAPEEQQGVQRTVLTTALEHFVPAGG